MAQFFQLWTQKKNTTKRKGAPKITTTTTTTNEDIRMGSSHSILRRRKNTSSPISAQNKNKTASGPRSSPAPANDDRTKLVVDRPVDDGTTSPVNNIASTPTNVTTTDAMPAPADDGLPLGRLWALCPYGTFREQPAHAMIGALLAKNAKNIEKNNKSQTSKKQRRGRRPCHNSADVSLYDDIDILAARGLCNVARSPLCRLPDDVLARILGYVDWDDMLCIRRTSRIFLRLFGRSEFSHLHDKGASGLFVLPTPWTSPAMPTGDGRLWFNMNKRLLQERYDTPRCSGFEKTLQTNYLHCTACNVDPLRASFRRHRSSPTKKQAHGGSVWRTRDTFGCAGTRR